MARPGRITPYNVAVAVIALGLVVTCVLVARGQWFLAEDFPHLARARGALPQLPWTWRGIFLPTNPGFNWVYRPLGLDLFFLAGYSTFGLKAFGFVVTSLLFHFGSGALVYLLARRLELDPRAAAFAALLSLAFFPTLSNIYWVCTFAYVFSKFWTLAAVLLSLDALRRERAAARAAEIVAATAACALGLLSHEIAVVTPAIVAAALLVEARSSTVKVPWGRLAIIVVAQLAVAAVWLHVRYNVVVVAPQPSFYGPFFGWNLVRNPLQQLALVFTSRQTLLLVVAFWLGLHVWLRMHQQDVASSNGPWLTRVVALTAVWLAAVLAPSSVVAAPQAHFSIPAEVPVALMVGASASAVWGAASGRLRGLISVAAIATVLLAIPYRALWGHAKKPRGALPRSLVQLVRHLPRLRPHASVFVLYGGKRLASAKQAKALVEATHEKAIFLAVWPEKRLRLLTHDIGKKPKLPPCVECVYLELRPDLGIETVAPPR